MLSRSNRNQNIVRIHKYGYSSGHKECKSLSMQLRNTTLSYEKNFKKPFESLSALKAERSWNEVSRNKKAA